MTDIGFALWLLRSARGWTQDQLAQRIRATREQVSDWEVGEKLPTVASVARICRGLEVSPAALLQIAEASASVVPQALEAPRAQLHVPDGVPNVGVPQVGLNQPKISATLRKVVAARMPERVRMDVQGSESRPFRHPVQHKLHPARGQRPATLRGENIVRHAWPFPFQSAQSSNLESSQPMITGDGALQTPDMENALVQVELMPARLQALLDTEPVREQNQYERRIPEAVAVLSCGVDEFFDFGFEKMFPHPRTTESHCSLYGDWDHIAHARNPESFHRVAPPDCTQKAQKGNS